MTPFITPPTPPIDSLPAYFRELVTSISGRLNVDPGMAIATLEASMASAAHGTTCVVHPEGSREPLSLFGILIAGPTTGKTRTFRTAHRLHLEEDRERHQQSVAMAESGRSSSSRARFPATDRIRWVSLQNTTNRALVETLEGVGESTAVSSDEGQNILSSDLFKRHLETCNALWDGSKVMLTRASGRSAVASDASLVSFVMTQPDMFETYRRKHGEVARGIGFFARTLFTIAGSTRFSPGGGSEVSDSCLAHYEAKVKELLTRQRLRADSRTNERREIGFTSEACAMYRNLEQQHIQSIPAQYPHMEDAANRAMQNVVRLAALLHIFSGNLGAIPAATLHGAFSLVSWHLAHFSSLFSLVATDNQQSAQQRVAQRAVQRDTQDREAILALIRELSYRRQSPTVLKSEVKTMFLAHAYDARFRAALLRLKIEGLVIESVGGKDARLCIASWAPWNCGPVFWTPMQGSV